MRIFYKTILIILALSIPVASIIASYNVVLRMPDMYSYEFNKKEIASEIDLAIQDDELGAFFSDFMFGKERQFDLVAEYRDREQSVFGTVEQIAMANAREMLNKSLYILAGLAVYILVIYGILIAKDIKLELRNSYKISIFVFVFFELITFTGFFIRGVRKYIYDIIFVNKFGADDVLPLMLTNSFARNCMVASFVISIIFLVVFGSLTWRLTKPKRLFWKQ